MNKQYDFKAVEGMLYNYNNIKAEIVDIELHIEELKDEVLGITGKSDNEIMPGSRSNAFSSVVENELLRKEQEIIDSTKERDTKARLARRIENMITILPDEDKQFVDTLYFKNNKVYRTSRKLNVTRDTIYKKKAAIVSSLANFLNRAKKQ